MNARRYVWIGALVAPLLCGAAAGVRRASQPPAPPPYSSPKRAVLFSDTFSGDLAAWRCDRAGVWSVAHHMLRAELPDKRQDRSLIWAGDSTWRDYALDFDVCMMRGVDKGAVVRGTGKQGIAVDVRGGSYQDVVAYAQSASLGKASAIADDGTWNHVTIEAVNDRLRVRINGVLRLDCTQPRFRQGRIALAAYTGGVGQCTVYYDNVVVTAR